MSETLEFANTTSALNRHRAVSLTCKFAGHVLSHRYLFTLDSSSVAIRIITYSIYSITFK